uniref:DNA binding protein n=1 Tax=Podoviridae sp. ctZkC8 TaxID=2825259 RepID=A0A8S5UBR1_9CAUD|nr:MAG TPA: DNA binding protein [Podoviridae sp. ctZkC8]
MKSYGSETYYHTSRVRFLQNLKTVLVGFCPPVTIYH